MDPIQKFENWRHAELKISKARIPTACCLSTIGLDGYPNARFVSLKEIVEGKFIITGPLNSRKGLEIEKTPKVSLTFWWAATEKQVRLQGDAALIYEEQAKSYFRERNFESKIVSHTSDQGTEVDDINKLMANFESKKAEFRGKEVPMPEDWGGFEIVPVRMEFMEFKPNRFHIRECFWKEAGEWRSAFLQP